MAMFNYFRQLRLEPLHLRSRRASGGELGEIQTGPRVFLAGFLEKSQAEGRCRHTAKSLSEWMEGRRQAEIGLAAKRMWSKGQGCCRPALSCSAAALYLLTCRTQIHGQGHPRPGPDPMPRATGRPSNQGHDLQP